MTKFKKLIAGTSGAMRTVLETIAAGVPTLLNKFRPNHIEFPVGAGYYSIRKNKASKGNTYFNLVKRDRSPLGRAIPGSDQSPITEPSVGGRTDRPARRRSRRNVPVVA